tara:strand:- start:1918 stop:3840 length:1923 start_codon:yes stop_codon:yes gene_type:complete
MSQNLLPSWVYFPRLLLLVSGSAFFITSVACVESSGGSEVVFDVTEKSIQELNSALESGLVTSEELVNLYYERIEAFDRRGPVLNSVITLNANALSDAARLDKERFNGDVRGPLHGIPVLVKDNYDTFDMPTTAGTLGLATSVPPDDAFQVHRLRQAGAVILGKTNMHELARGITTVSSLTGQTRNPYDPSRNPGGSSGGTGAAIGASFAAVGMGSDTCGSIRIPSSHQALVGLRGTRGLASGDGIIPLSTTQDIGGPLARSVEDLAITLDATVGYDPEDPTTDLSRGNVPDSYTEYLDADSLQGARLGIVMSLMGSGRAEQPVRDVIEAAVQEMIEHGAEIIEIEEPDLTELLQGASVIGQEFKFDFDAYLDQTPDATVGSLREMISLGLYHEIIDTGLHASLEYESRDTDEYRERLEKRSQVRNTTVGVMEEHQLDALIYPTIRQTARPIGQSQPGSSCALSAISGLPAISVPAGFAVDGMPVGVELLGRPFDESRLISLAFAFEQNTFHRRPPDFTPSLATVPLPVDLEATVISTSDVSGRASFMLDPSTRRVDYSVSVYGIRDSDVLAIDLHRRLDDSENGPSIRRLGGKRARISSHFILTGRELHLLREGNLYLDVHTQDNVPGVLKVNLLIPGS